jgi:N6-L-threonylcarbamoyladenine synthase
MDNGVMIAWNGVEKFRRNIDIYPTDRIDELDFAPKFPIGESYIEKVRELNISCNWVKPEILKPYARA